LVEITAHRAPFAHRIDMLDAAGEIQEHLAGVEDYILAEAFLARSNLTLSESTHRPSPRRASRS
jgi:hypothetical protein